MSRPENTKLRIFFAILLGCVSVFLYYYILNQIQNKNMMDQTQKEMEGSARLLKSSFPDAEIPFQDIQLASDEICESELKTLLLIFQHDPDFEISDSYLKSLKAVDYGGDLMIADREGHVLACVDGTHEDLTDPEYDPLRDTFKTNSVSILHMPDNPQEANLWYALAFDEKYELVINGADKIRTAYSSDAAAWNSLLNQKTIGQDGFVFVWSDKTDEVLYYPEMSGDSISIETLGIDPDQVRDEEYGWYDINGRRMYLYTSLYKDRDVWIACAIPADELESSRRFTISVFCMAFALLVGALVYYVILLLLQKKVKVLKDFTGSGEESSHKSRQKKLLILTCLMVVILFLFQYLLQTLYMMSTWAEYATKQTGSVEQRIREQEDFAKKCTELYEGEKLIQLNVLSAFLAAHPELCTTVMLDDFSFAINAIDIQVLDKEGKSKVGTSSMSYVTTAKINLGDATTDYAEAVAAQDNEKRVFEWMSEGRRVILPLEGSENASFGYLYVRYYSEPVDQALQYLNLEGTLKRIQPGNGGFVFSVDEETKKFTYFPTEELIGRDALEYGLTENQIKDNYCDYISINGTPYYSVTDILETNVIYYSISKNRLLGSRFMICIMAVVSAAVLLLLTGLPLYSSREQIELIRPDEERHTPVEDRKSPEYRTLRVLFYYTVAAAATVSAYSIFRANTGTGGVIGYVLDGNWERGLNVFALFSAAIILSQGGLILFFFSKLIHLVGGILPVRGGTILKMLGSLVTYLAIAFLIYRCMICFGLNPTALMASAGIVSVVLGIGANSLVGDILAGIFLLMEGNIQVGDVVQIGDFRGYVMEMGIRMTKLFDMDMDDVKIIPNNEVRNVVHMTMRASIVYSDFQIRYEENLDSVERILRDELKNVPDKSPLILDGPVYIGVRDLGESGVVLRTATRCHEPCRRKVEREVNHIVYSIFQKNGISVPYPQVTVHAGDDSPVER